ncbi:MAG: hypothetical protein JNK78_17980 [Planctomycetes bacterium]|nr:hypothetical protein [Planctomycetota bacterium]
MGSELSRIVVSTSLLAVCALAQNTTVPATMDGIEGGGGTSIPFGSNLACRYQALYDVEELPWTGPRVITGISLRADNTPAGLAMAGKQFLDISILMSTSPRRAADASSTFADNYGIDATWVVNHQITALPAQPIVASGPRAANIDFTFTVPWAYGLTPAIGTGPAPTSLLVEIWIHSQPSGVYRIDNLSSCTSPTATFGNQGPACAVPGKQPVALTTDTTMLAGSPFAWHIANADANAIFLVGLGTSGTGSFLGQAAWALPMPLFDPANPSVPWPTFPYLGYSAPDCWLNIDPVLWLGGVCDPAGVGYTSIDIPPGREMVGATYYGQALVVAPTANPLRLVTSDGRSATVCGPLGVARVFSFYNTTTVPPQPLPLTGSMQVGVGPIFDVH